MFYGAGPWPKSSSPWNSMIICDNFSSLKFDPLLHMCCCFYPYRASAANLYYYYYFIITLMFMVEAGKEFHLDRQMPISKVQDRAEETASDKRSSLLSVTEKCFL